MRVKLESVGNPDYRQDPEKPLWGAEPNRIVPVDSFKQASDECIKFIDENELGGGNWSGGDILNDEGEVIASVSYNGRVWDNKGNEILID